jgi:hypothetical protein
LDVGERDLFDNTISAFALRSEESQDKVESKEYFNGDSNRERDTKTGLA